MNQLDSNSLDEKIVSKTGLVIAAIPVMIFLFLLWVVVQAGKFNHHNWIFSFYLFMPLSILFRLPRMTMTAESISVSPLWEHLLGRAPHKSIRYDDITSVTEHRYRDQKIYTITATNDDKVHIAPLHYRNATALSTYLFRHISTDKITIASPRPTFVGADIGIRPRVVAYSGLVFGLLSIALMSYGLHNYHPGFALILPYLIVSAPLSFVLTYLWVKREGKYYPLKASCVAALFPALALAYGGSTLNQWLSERYGTTTSAEFLYADYYNNCQSFVPVNASYIHLHTDDGGAHICARQQGYAANLALGATYRINIIRGYLNDISFPVNAFQNAVMTHPAPAKIAPIASPKLINDVTPSLRSSPYDSK